MFFYDHLPNSSPNPRLLRTHFQPLVSALATLQLDAELVLLLDRAVKLPTPVLRRMLLDLPKKASVIKCNSFMHDAVFPLLSVKSLINTDEEVVVVNNIEIFTKTSVNIPQAVASLQQYDAGVIVNATSKLNKFAKLNSEGHVSEISSTAENNSSLFGVYYWQKGSELIESAEDMLANAPDKTNISDTLNVMINKQKQIGSFSI